MSAALVRRGLELLSDDVLERPDEKKKKQKEMKLSRSKRSSRAPPTDHNRATARGRKIRKYSGGGQQAAAAAGPLRSHASVLPPQRLLGLGGEHTEDRESELGPALPGPGDGPGADAQRPQSVFTEDEFQQFQKDYFGRLVEEQ
ncbi:hypothetical protein WMY93_005804 [Mugilogobius chulae]|uniref:Active regulator of SIRT1 n=1 Tax=Mugilogobius chulae TaxID=88201 RepID=A0AAW0PTM6_9GOBI